MGSLSSDNKLIFKNTIIIYARMIIVTLVGLFSSRFVLQALGVSDYGLYNIVAGLITMLNFVGIAMCTTTRRFINIEMGKPDGNLNKVFNVSLLIHIGFALFIFVVAETIGLWYIHNLLNVETGKETDAMFVFQISTIVACIGIINIPYQSLIEAHERFFSAAVIDVITTLTKLGLVIILIYYPGNCLRLYAVFVCAISIVSFILYHWVCWKNWKEIIRHKLYRRCAMYKDIFVFNNYIALGAAVSIGGSYGNNLLVNYFFGTVVNGAFAIAYQVDSCIYMFVNKITLATNPQIAKNYAKGTLERSNRIMEKNSKYSILIMTVFYFIAIVDLDFVLDLWLGKAPEGAGLLCFLTLTCALVRSFGEGTNGYVQASGKIKWFQIVGSALFLLTFLISFVLFKLGYDAYVLLVCSVISSIVGKILSLTMMYKILNFNVKQYLKNAYLKPLICISALALIVLLIQSIPAQSVIQHLGIIFLTGLTSLICVYAIGLDKEEKSLVLNLIKRK